MLTRKKTYLLKEIISYKYQKKQRISYTCKKYHYYLEMCHRYVTLLLLERVGLVFN